ncbi:MAG: GNAT family N-acetyltransferase [Pseudomonadota bacterium]
MPQMIRPAEGPEDLKRISALFLAYATWLESEHGITLAFQNFDAELASLPGKYVPPEGGLFLAEGAEGALWGCVAFRPLEGRTCEIKRLYVVPEARGRALGKDLVRHVLEAAKAAGYQRAVLDTGAFMASAQRLYEGFGFKDPPP